MKRILCALALSIAALAQTPAPQPQKLQVLIITGQNAPDWRSTTPVLRQMLEDTGKFEVRVMEEYLAMREVERIVQVPDYPGETLGVRRSGRRNSTSAIRAPTANGTSTRLTDSTSGSSGNAPR